MRENELDIEKRWLLLARNDPAAFDRFYDKYFDAIYGYLLRRTMDHDTAEDLTSETFLLAQRSLWRFRWQGVTFGAYLFRIAQNQLRKRARKLKWEAELGDEEVTLVDPRLNPLAQVVLSDEQQAVRRAVAELDASTQEIVLLHYWEGLTSAEIAAVMGMKTTTVKTRLHRGRARLKQVLLGVDGGDEDGGGDARGRNRASRRRER